MVFSQKLNETPKNWENNAKEKEFVILEFYFIPHAIAKWCNDELISDYKKYYYLKILIILITCYLVTGSFSYIFTG